MPSKRDKIRLISSAGTGHFYTTNKNKKNMPEKMEIKKYRSRRPQARDLQGRQDQVSARRRPTISADCYKARRMAGFVLPVRRACRHEKGPPVAGPFVSCDACDQRVVTR